jgi:hypothetical protein
LMLTRQYFVARTVKTQILHNPPHLSGALTLNLFLTYIKPKKNETPNNPNPNPEPHFSPHKKFPSKRHVPNTHL